jgi:hypothetical protein
MTKLEDLQPNASVQGILPNCLVTVVSAQWHGSEALELTYKDPSGKVANELLYRHDEPTDRSRPPYSQFSRPSAARYHRTYGRMKTSTEKAYGFLDGFEEGKHSGASGGPRLPRCPIRTYAHR